ncbi:unnamed protein product [Porites evermanni]|uniref:Uncharacterized protein n=1 Tax=Porites evermanni TaxID=104178 RepID=A0ABN8M8R8_9CNID|nr:unnamed protein product [Porites evermanni]
MAATAARCIRSLSRSSTVLSSSITRHTSQRSMLASSSPLLKSFVSTESGLLKGSRNVAISSRLNISKRFAPSFFVCNVAQACPLSIDVGCEVSDALDDNLGDDDGDTWSQSDDEPYQGDT